MRWAGTTCLSGGAHFRSLLSVKDAVNLRKAGAHKKGGAGAPPLSGADWLLVNRQTAISELPKSPVELTLSTVFIARAGYLGAQ